MTGNTTHTYTTSGTYIITLALTGGATRWTFQFTTYSPLVPKA
jgi:PKD repeat protein